MRRVQHEANFGDISQQNRPVHIVQNEMHRIHILRHGAKIIIIPAIRSYCELVSQFDCGMKNIDEQKSRIDVVCLKLPRNYRHHKLSETRSLFHQAIVFEADWQSAHIMFPQHNGSPRLPSPTLPQWEKESLFCPNSKDIRGGPFMIWQSRSIWNSTTQRLGI